MRVAVVDVRSFCELSLANFAGLVLNFKNFLILFKTKAVLF